MLYDATGRPIRPSASGDRGSSGGAPRPVSEAEARYVRRCVRHARRFSRFALSVPVAAGGFFVYLGVTEDEPGAMVAALLTCAALTAVFAWVYRRSLRLEVEDPLIPERVEGTYRRSRGLQHVAHFVGAREVKMPLHWMSYLRQGDRVRVDAVPTPAAAYALRSDGGLSIDDEMERGLEHLIDPELGLVAALWMAPAIGSLIALMTFVLLALSGRDDVGVVSGLDSPLIHYALASTLVFGSIAGVLLGRHLRARRRIHRMYFRRGLDHALSPAERRRFRLRDAAWGAGGFALGGVALAVGFGFPLLPSVLAMTALGAPLGAVLREPTPDATSPRSR